MLEEREGRAAEAGPLSQTLVAFVICINSSNDDKDGVWFRNNETGSWGSFFVCLFVFSDCSHFLLKGRITSLTKSGRYGGGQRYWEKLKGRSKERPL